MRENQHTRQMPIRMLLALSAVAAFPSVASAQPDMTGQDDPTLARPKPPAAVQSQQQTAAPPMPGAPHPLAGVTAIVEADVISAQYYYDEAIGPRTEVALDNMVVHAGKAPVETTFSQLGGPLPDGSMIGVSELPVLNPAARYIFFFGAADWYYTPVWAGLAFRVESIQGKKVVLNQDGKPVQSFGVDGVHFGKTSFLDDSAQTDPLKPRAVMNANATAKSVADDLSAALDVATFVKAAKAAVGTIGSPLGTPKLLAKARQSWRVEPTATGPSH